jgi:hypothetical protein
LHVDKPSGDIDDFALPVVSQVVTEDPCRPDKSGR